MLRYIGIYISAFLISFSSLASAQQNALPKRIQVNYAVTKNGLPFAKVREQFVITGNTYQVESVTKGIGIYALFGERQLTSQGDVNRSGLKPQRFELHQGSDEKHSLIANFDWPNKILHMTVKGTVKEDALTSGIQDLASYPYQFMFLPKPLKNKLLLKMTTGKKLNLYEYKISKSKEVLKIAGTQYNTLHLAQVANQTSSKLDSKDLWLSVDRYYLPVRLVIVDDNGQKLEQTLTELHAE